MNVPREAKKLDGGGSLKLNGSGVGFRIALKIQARNVDPAVGMTARLLSLLGSERPNRKAGFYRKRNRGCAPAL